MAKTLIALCLGGAVLSAACGSAVEDAGGGGGAAPPPPALATLMAAYASACWIEASGGVACMNKPVGVVGIDADVKALFGGPCAFGTCAETDDGSFVCWEELASDPPPSFPIPATTVGMARGAEFLCALSRDGAIVCGGQFASMGAARLVGVDDQGTVSALSDLKSTQVAAGTTHACAVIDDGSVVCWGTNDFGELGTLGETTPTPVPALPNDVVQVGAGLQFSCARTSRGEVYCWGAMVEGTAPRPPERVDGLPTIIDMAVSEHNVCARSDVGDVWCWGDDLSRQAGVTPEVASVPPTVLGGISGTVLELSGGGLAFYARTSDGRVWEWGVQKPPHLVGR